MPDKEFLLRVRQQGDSYVATCQSTRPLDPWSSGVDEPVEGLGSSALAACIAALTNSQVQDITGTEVA